MNADHQLTPDDVAAMSDDQLLAAKRAGRLDRLYGRTVQLTRADLDRMSEDQINRALDEGRLARVLGQPDLAPPYVDDDTPITRELLSKLDPTRIVDLHSRGKLDHLLRPGR